ncbi:MAG: class I SAM-dependent methyltransferase [Deltaproteobacteria bacterium]|nr:class I SAM-dependent methyltransferase [Deltaproteobacteria bacterium]
MNDRKTYVCPASHAWSLDNTFRRLLQNPVKILAPHVSEGMTAFDIGCGPGFFTIAMAELAGESGKVIAVDLQEEMLGKVHNKVRGTKLEKRIKLHRCEKERLNITEYADFALAFYVVHEVPDQACFFRELFSALKPCGKALIVEPKVFHVSKKEFEETVNAGETAGFKVLPGPAMFFGRTAILERPDNIYA